MNRAGDNLKKANDSTSHMSKSQCNTRNILLPRGKPSKVNTHIRSGTNQNQSRNRRFDKGASTSMLVPIPSKHRSSISESKVEGSMSPASMSVGVSSGNSSALDLYDLSQEKGFEADKSSTYSDRSSRRSSISSLTGSSIPRADSSSPNYRPYPNLSIQNNIDIINEPECLTEEEKQNKLKFEQEEAERLALENEERRKKEDADRFRALEVAHVAFAKQENYGKAKVVINNPTQIVNDNTSKININSTPMQKSKKSINRNTQNADRPISQKGGLPRRPIGDNSPYHIPDTKKENNIKETQISPSSNVSKPSKPSKQTKKVKQPKPKSKSKSKTKQTKSEPAIKLIQPNLLMSTNSSNISDKVVLPNKTNELCHVTNQLNSEHYNHEIKQEVTGITFDFADGILIQNDLNSRLNLPKEISQQLKEGYYSLGVDLANCDHYIPQKEIKEEKPISHVAPSVASTMKTSPPISVVNTNSSNFANISVSPQYPVQIVPQIVTSQSPVSIALKYPYSPDYNMVWPNTSPSYSWPVNLPINDYQGYKQYMNQPLQSVQQYIPYPNYQAYQGMQGIQGMQGNQGIQGIQGIQSMQGIQDNQGSQDSQDNQNNQNNQDNQGDN